MPLTGTMWARAYIYGGFILGGIFSQSVASAQGKQVNFDAKGGTSLNFF